MSNDNGLTIQRRTLIGYDGYASTSSVSCIELCHNVNIIALGGKSMLSKKTRLLCLRRIVLIYLCEAADMRNVFAQINENIESVNCRYFSVAQCATLQTTLQKGILSTKEISSFVHG